MKFAIEHDRQAHLLLGGDPALGYEDARLRLERAALVVSAGGAASMAWGQAALLTIAECATRMFRGGVYLAQEFCEPVIVGSRRPVPLKMLLVEAGCRPRGSTICFHSACRRGRTRCSQGGPMLGGRMGRDCFATISGRSAARR